MPRRGNRNVKVLDGAGPALDAFKMEIAKELGLDAKIREEGWSHLTTQEVGAIGGEMTKRMILAGEQAIKQRFGNGETAEPSGAGSHPSQEVRQHSTSQLTETSPKPEHSEVR